MTPLRRTCASLAGLALAASLAACGASPARDAASRAASPASPAAGSAAAWAAGWADEAMPAAPPTDASWLATLDQIYHQSATHSASPEDWLRHRAANRRPGERLALVMGIDDVMLQTHFAGLAMPVPPSAELVRLAHQLGYAVFYVTGRPDGSTGLAQATAALRHEGVPIDGVCGRAPGDTEAQGKAACRTAIERSGYTIAMVVAASEASFDGSPSPERAVRLPAFV